MRSPLLALPALLLIGVGPATAADRDAALAVLEAAVKAHGGADVLSFAQMTRSGTGVLSIGASTTMFTDELTAALPDRLRLGIDTGRDRIIVVLNKDRGWQRVGGMTADLSPARLEEIRSEAYLIWLTTLAPLLKDESLTLAPLPDAKVNDAAASVIKVSRKGQPDVRLSFDKTSHLLIKADRKAREEGVEFNQEWYYSDHKDFDGAKLPTRLIETRSGRKFNELTGQKYKLSKSADDAAFGKP